MNIFKAKKTGQTIYYGWIIVLVSAMGIFFQDLVKHTVYPYLLGHLSNSLTDEIDVPRPRTFYPGYSNCIYKPYNLSMKVKRAYPCTE